MSVSLECRLLNRGAAVLLRTDCLEHGRHLVDLRRGDVGKRVPIEMHGASLPQDIGVALTARLGEAHALVGDEQLNAAKAS